MTKDNEVVLLYEKGNSIKDILIASGYKSQQSIMNILDRNGIPRNNIKTQSLPIEEIVNEWVDNISVNTRSISKKFGCSTNTISSILKKNIPENSFNEIKRNKISESSIRQRQNLSKKERIERAKYASQFVNPIERNKRLLEGAKISAQKRKGVPLSPEKYKYFVTDRIILKGENHPSWKGGVSKRQSRKPNWDKYQKLCRERDNHTCQNCGTTKEIVGQNMDVHHIISYHSFEDKKLANQLSNLISLCRVCHLRTEQKIYRSKK